MNISITALSGTLAGTKITQIINPAYKYQNIPGSRTDEADIWSSLQIDRVEQRTWCTKQKNASVRQRQNMIGKKQSWKEKKDQGREESPSYDQHVKPRKKNGKLFWKQSSELVSRLAVFVWKTCARRLLADWFFPVSLDLSFKKWWDFFNIYGKRGKRWQYSVILWEKQIPCSQPMQKVSFFVYKWLKQMSKWGIPWDSHEASSWDTW